MAAGAWLLSTAFITASAAAHTLVEPDAYELEKGCSLVAEGAPLHWRMRAQSLGHGAFHGLRVLVHGTFKTNVKPNRKDIASILAAGGATQLSMQEAVAQGADLAIMPPGTAKTAIKELLKAGVTCASPQYVVEWIAHPNNSLTEHLLHATAESGKLAEMAKERGEYIEAEEQSCSF
ncbi:g6579 [Coccomyxa elongata]